MERLEYNSYGGPDLVIDAWRRGPPTHLTPLNAVQGGLIRMIGE